MTLRRPFIRSVGLRAFVLYVLAAAVPVALLAMLSSRAVDDAAAQALAQTLAGNAKSTALLTVDRLRVAQQYLRGGSRLQAGIGSVPDVTAALPPVEAAVVADPAHPQDLSLGRLGPLQLAPVLAAAQKADQRDVLMVVPAIGPGHKASIVIGQRLPAGQWRLGAVNPDYLWQDTGDLPPGFWVCVVGPRREILFCPDEAAVGRALATAGRLASDRSREPGADASVIGRDVFLSGSFSGDNWLVFAGAGPDGDLRSTAPDLRWRVLGAAIAGILLAAVLSLTQLRRMLVPLHRLRDGARALAAGRLDARIAVTSQDEFAELAGSFNDMAGRLERQFTEMETLASNDSLTGLLNRHGLKEAFDQLARGGGEIAVVYIDVDRFKTVNDTLGHHAGDRVLEQVAQRCLSALPAGACLSRPAGDEFVALLGGPDVRAAAQRIAADVCAAVAVPMHAADSVFFLGASIGIAFYPDNGGSIDALVRCADIAMYQSKRRGSGQVTLFDERFDQQAQRRHWIERDLHTAVSKGQLHLQFQPRVQAETHLVSSVEALVRWQHPIHGLVSPNDFVPVAEESDLILDIGDWVMDAACRQARAWRDLGLTELRVALNVSVRQLRLDDLDTRLLQSTRRWEVPASCIEIEITESVLATDIEHVKSVLSRLRVAGFTVAIDDFGTGFSSLSYLRHLPFDILKIDRAFVLDLDGDTSARAIAHSIVALGKALGKRIVAEGVETATQAQWLWAIGCDEIQGFHHGRPMDGERLNERLLAEAASGSVPGRHRVLM
jgi:diguanylate cyclase (GGDEF)-like protein